ncbi:MAG: outer membrane protein assembly factor BamD [Planctomycetes bacterium]|nr:outer membrane protein assembly factor BamD [Planctomycetota bacterium]
MTGRPSRLLVVLLLAGLGGACSSLPEGVDRVEVVRSWLAAQRYDDALDGCEEILEDDEDEDAVANGLRLSRVERADVWFTAAESALALGEHRKAYTYYRQILENAPWSTYTAVIEDRLFTIGEAFFFSDEYDGIFDDRGRGVEVFETLQVHFHRSDRADDALRLIADYFEREEDWLSASTAYERLWKEYPESEWAERALWRAGHDRLQLVGGPEYDQQGLLAARELLSLSVAVHPRGVAVDEAQADLARANDMLAGFEVLVADFYAGRGIAEGEALHLTNAVLMYPQTPSGQVAAARLAALGLTAVDSPSTSSIDKARRVPPPWEDAK